MAEKTNTPPADRAKVKEKADRRAAVDNLAAKFTTASGQPRSEVDKLPASEFVTFCERQLAKDPTAGDLIAAAGALDALIVGATDNSSDLKRADAEKMTLSDLLKAAEGVPTA